MLAIAGVLSVASCQQEELPNASTDGDYVNARFILEAPDGIPTRAIGDGTQADVVKCVVYDAEGTKMDLDQTLPIVGKKATYEIRLAKGQQYRVAFFAYNQAADAYDVTDMKNIVVKGDQMSNIEARDAFTAYVDITAADSMQPVEKNVILYRPFAQLNIGAYMDDVAAAAKAGVVVANSKVTLSNVYTAFNAYADAVAGQTSEVTFSMNAIPSEDLLVDVNGDGVIADNERFAYLAMNYILVGDKGTEKSLTDVGFVWENADASKTNVPQTVFVNIPVQRNYRTNIIGDILTNPAKFSIIIDERFEKPDHIVGIPVPVEENNGVFEVSTPSELAWIAQEVNSGNTFAGKTVLLAADIDLSNYASWTPIGNVTNYPSQTFAGVFDGNEKTISNLTVADYTPAEASAALFGSISGEVKNLTVTNATITSTHYAAAIVGYTSDAAKITNCHVDGATITTNYELVSAGAYDNADKAGAIVGILNNPAAVVDGCTVKNVTITGYRDLGGVAGYSAGTVQNCQVLENVSITVDATHPYKGYTQPSQYDVNSIVGENAGTMTGNTGEATLKIPAAVAAVATAAELKAMLNDFTDAGSGNNTINLTNDIILKDAWTPVVIDGYNGAGVITINGNGHKIQGLTAPLLAGGFAGNSGVIITDLTIDKSAIVSTNTLGSGAFIETVDSQPLITLRNCHLTNSSLTGSRTGGLLGWTSGYNDPNNGPVDTYITLENCSVVGCQITGAGTVGGLYGHAGANPATFSIISNCTVQNCTLTSNDDSYRVGVVLGTANLGQVTITGITESGNTVIQNDNGTIIPRPAGQSYLYGRFVPGTTGKLAIDGVAVN